MNFRAILRPLLPFLKESKFGLSAAILLGIVASVFEGVGIGLFLPLLDTTGGASHTRSGAGLLSRTVGAILDGVSSQQRTLVLAGIIIAALVLKVTAGYFANTLAARVNLEVGHRIRSRVFAQLLNSGYAFLTKGRWGETLDILTTETWRTMDLFGYAL